MRIKLKKKTVLAILMMGILIICFGSVFAETTPVTPQPEQFNLFGGILSALSSVLSTLGGILFFPIIALAIGMAGLITIVFGQICSTLIGDLSGKDVDLYFPFPDQIVFNKLAAFDPNFINPAKGGSEGWSLIELMSKIVSPLYFTSQTLVFGIFIILALIIGIKLAISATAQEKSQYKTAISKWILGIFFLYIGHIYMSGIFTINERIVASISEAADNVPLPIALVTVEDLGDVFGVIKQIGIEIVNVFLPEEWEIGSALSYRIVHGYSGLLYFHIVNASINHDIASLIIWYILLGQTVALMILYFKRVFYSIFLGIIYPYTVAFDTVQKINGKNNGVLDHWIKTFTTNVFTQVFHAFIIYFSMVLISELIGLIGTPVGDYEIVNPEAIPNSGRCIIQGEDEKESVSAAGITSLLQIIAITSIVSLEKLIKEFTGIQTGKAGNVNSNGLQMLAGLKLASAGAKNLGDNISGVRKAGRQLRQARVNKYEAQNKLAGKKGTGVHSKEFVPNGQLFTKRALNNNMKRTQAIDSALATLNKRKQNPNFKENPKHSTPNSLREDVKEALPNSVQRMLDKRDKRKIQQQEKRMETGAENVMQNGKYSPMQTAQRTAMSNGMRNPNLNGMETAGNTHQTMAGTANMNGMNSGSGIRQTLKGANRTSINANSGQNQIGNAPAGQTNVEIVGSASQNRMGMAGAAGQNYAGMSGATGQNRMGMAGATGQNYTGMSGATGQNYMGMATPTQSIKDLNSSINNLKNEIKTKPNSTLNTNPQPALNANVTQTPDKTAALKQEYIKAVDAERDALVELRKKTFASMATPGITIASMGIGMGTANSIDDVLAVSGVIASTLDKAVESGAQKAFGRMTPPSFSVKIPESSRGVTNNNVYNNMVSSAQAPAAGTTKIINNTTHVTNPQAPAAGATKTINNITNVTNPQAPAAGATKTINNITNVASPQVPSAGATKTINNITHVTNQQAPAAGATKTINNITNVTNQQAPSAGTAKIINNTTHVTKNEQTVVNKTTTTAPSRMETTVRGENLDSKATSQPSRELGSKPNPKTTSSSSINRLKK